MRRAFNVLHDALIPTRGEADLPKHLLTVMALAPFFLDVIHGELQADDGRVSIGQQ